MTFRILVADDEADTKLLIRESISSSLSEPVIINAENGNDAIEQARSQDFDLIIIDLIIPFTNGVEALKVIHMSEPDLPIIAVTASDDHEMKEEALKSGASLVLEKPLQLKHLSSAIKNMVGVQE